MTAPGHVIDRGLLPGEALSPAAAAATPLRYILDHFSMYTEAYCTRATLLEASGPLSQMSLLMGDGGSGPRGNVRGKAPPCEFSYM